METTNTDLSALKIDRSKKSNKPSQARKTVNKLIVSASAVLIIILGGSYLWNHYVNTAVDVKVTSVMLQSPSSSSTGAVLTASGYVVAQRQASVASKGTGRLVYLGVVEGDQVRKDQIIARLEDNDIRAQLAQARANLKLSEADLKDAERYLARQKALFKTGSTTEELLDAAEARYLKVLANIDISKAMVQSADVALENMLIRAPFNGTVLTKNADVGEIVAPLSASTTSRAAVVTIADMSSLQVEADVSESNIQRISQNQDCDITLDAYPGKRYNGYVAKIVPTADRSKATVQVKVGFREYDSHVLPEMSAKVSFLLKQEKQNQTEEKPVLLVPASAVTDNNGKKTVFTIKDGAAEETIITTERSFGEYLEVSSGLSAGEQVIDNPGENIKDGTKVKVD